MKKIYIIGVLLLGTFILNGCTSNKYKEELLNEKLNEMYNNYSIVDSCSYWNEAGGDELESIVKVENDYFLSSINVHNKQISAYEEQKILQQEQYNDYIYIIETTSYYDNTSVVFFVDDSIEKNYVANYITDFCLNYSENDKVEGFYIDVYYVLDFDKNKTIYKEFAVSQTANRCDYEFYKRYKEKVGIINDFQEYRQWLPTKIHESYKNNYKEYIKEKLAETNFQ